MDEGQTAGNNPRYQLKKRNIGKETLVQITFGENYCNQPGEGGGGGGGG